MRRRVFCVVAVFFAALPPASATAQSFVAFESGQVRPLAMSPDGTRLFAVNTPDNRLEIFDIQSGMLEHSDFVPVGLEPVASRRKPAARPRLRRWIARTGCASACESAHYLD